MDWDQIFDLTKDQENTKSHFFVIDNTIFSDPETVANTFNDFFTSVADNVRSTIPPSNHHFSDFLKTVIEILFFFSQSVQRKSLKLLDPFQFQNPTVPTAFL